MAFLFGDTFDHYATAELAQKWTQIITNNDGGSAVSANGRNGSSCYRSVRGAGGGVNNANRLAVTLGASGATCIVGLAFRCNGAFNLQTVGTTWGTATAALIAIRQGGTVHVWLRPNTNGTLSVYNGDGTLIGTTDAGMALSESVYAYIELKVLIHASAGTVDVRINGSSALSATGKDTQNTASATWDEVVIGPTNGVGVSFDFDDVMIMDGSGSLYNDLVGDHQGLYVPANAEGNHQDGTPSTGSDLAAVVDEASANGDTDYLTHDTVGHRASFTLATWPAAGDIGPIQVVAQARKEEEGAADVNLFVRVDSVDHDGADQGINTSYAIKRQIFEQDPENTAAWQAGTAPEIGVEKAA
jgi:hypothetical protein